MSWRNEGRNHFGKISEKFLSCPKPCRGPFRPLLKKCQNFWLNQFVICLCEICKFDKSTFLTAENPCSCFRPLEKSMIKFLLAKQTSIWFSAVFPTIWTDKSFDHEFLELQFFQNGESFVVWFTILMTKQKTEISLAKQPRKSVPP